MRKLRSLYPTPADRMELRGVSFRVDEQPAHIERIHGS